MIASLDERPAASPRQHRSEVGDVGAVDATGVDRARQLAPVGGLCPLVAVELAGDDGVDRRLGLARTVGAEHVEVHPGPQVGLGHDRLVARRDAGDDVTRQRLLARSRAPAVAELRRQRLGDVRPWVVADARRVARGDQAARRPRTVQARADQPGARSAGRRERQRRHRRDGAGSQRGDRAGIDDRQRLGGRGVRQQHDAHHGRLAVRGVARERADPLQHREPVAERGHRAEVAVRRRVEVDLGRHRPFAAAVAQERLARVLDRVAWRDGFEHGGMAEDGDGAHRGRR